jgi:hypothetical protein
MHHVVVLVISTLVGIWLKMPVAVNCAGEVAAAGLTLTD